MNRSKWWTLPGKFIRKSGADRLLLGEAFGSLAIARLAIRLAPFRRIEPFLGRRMAESPRAVRTHAETAKRISWAVRTAGRYTPWKSACLAQAIAAKMMLKIRGATSTLYLGLKRNEDEGLCAHAWLRHGETILTGRPGLEEFVMIVAFAEKERP
jgi:hypothetical protein